MMIFWLKNVKKREIYLIRTETVDKTVDKTAEIIADLNNCKFKELMCDILNIGRRSKTDEIIKKLEYKLK